MKFILWLKENKKTLLMSIIIGTMLFLLISLVWTNIDFETSPFYYFSNSSYSYPIFELSQEEIDTWAIRGQIGDILAGHFSAFAFFAIALSIYFQSEGNKQIQESIKQQENSIKQQKDALILQSNALKAQIEELKASREESIKQTEEFFISNMNVKLDRYYRILDGNLEKITDDFYTIYEKSTKTFESLSEKEIKSPTGIHRIKMDL